MSTRQPRTAATRRRWAVACVLLVTSGVSAACTRADVAPATVAGSGSPAGPVLEVRAPVTRVSGRLDDADKLALRRQVESLLGDYVTAAFLDPPEEGSPSSPASLFPGFTDGAVQLARQRGAILSRADLGAGAVGPRRVTAAVTALAPGGHASGATAYVDIVLETADDGGGRVHLEGRFLLTPVGTTWRVFGFDVRRTER